MSKVQGWHVISEIAKRLLDAGAITEAQYRNCTRIVIDLSPQSLPMMYMETILDEAVLDVLLPSIDGIKVVTQKDGVYDGSAEDNPRDGEEGSDEPEEQNQAEPERDPIREFTDRMLDDTSVSGADGWSKPPATTYPGADCDG